MGETSYDLIPNSNRGKPDPNCVCLFTVSEVQLGADLSPSFIPADEVIMGQLQTGSSF